MEYDLARRRIIVGQPVPIEKRRVAGFAQCPMKRQRVQMGSPYRGEPEEHGLRGEGRVPKGTRVKSIFVIAVNQPPHINPIISVCFSRTTLGRQSRIEVAQVP